MMWKNGRARDLHRAKSKLFALVFSTHRFYYIFFPYVVAYNAGRLSWGVAGCRPKYVAVQAGYLQCRSLFCTISIYFYRWCVLIAKWHYVKSDGLMINKTGSVPADSKSKDMAVELVLKCIEQVAMTHRSRQSVPYWWSELNCLCFVPYPSCSRLVISYKGSNRFVCFQKVIK